MTMTASPTRMRKRTKSAGWTKPRGSTSAERLAALARAKDTGHWNSFGCCTCLTGVRVDARDAEGEGEGEAVGVLAGDDLADPDDFEGVLVGVFALIFFFFGNAFFSLFLAVQDHCEREREPRLI